MISVDRLDRVYHEEVGREQGGLREQLAHARPNPFQHCHDLAWDRVEFKMLRFNKQAVPGDFTDNVKDIRRLP